MIDKPFKAFGNLGAARTTPDRSFNSAGIDSMLQDHTQSMTDAIGDMTRSHYTDAKTAAQKAGYTIKGNQAVKYVPGMQGRGIPSYTPLSQFGGSTGPQVDPTLGGALVQDTNVQNAVAKDQWGRVNNRIAGIDNFVGQIDDRLLGQSDDLWGELTGQAKNISDLGNQQRADFEEGQRPVAEGLSKSFDETMQGLNKANADIDQGYKIADEAVSYAEGVRRGYMDTGAMEASAAASGMARSFKEQERSIASGLLPDGTKMSPEEQVQAHAELNYKSKMAIQEQITPILARFNETNAQLGQMVAQMKMGAGQLRIQGAGERKGIAMAGMESGLGVAQAMNQMNDQRLQSMQNQQQAAQAAAQLYQVGAQVRQSAMFKAAEMMMQGMEKAGEMVMQNPRSVVSYFQGLLGLMSAQAAMAGARSSGGTVTAKKEEVPQAKPQAAQQAPQKAQAPAKEYSWDRVTRERKEQARTKNAARKSKKSSESFGTAGMDESRSIMR